MNIVESEWWLRSGCKATRYTQNFFLNYIAKVSKKLEPISFADDTDLYCSGQENILLILETERVKKKWFKINKLLIKFL